jgi:hypothetical protein
MKCSNPDCNRGIGLVHHRRWFSKRRYCSRKCRDAFVADPPRSQKEPSVPTFFERLFLQPIRNPQQKWMPAVVPTKRTLQPIDVRFWG